MKWLNRIREQRRSAEEAEKEALAAKVQANIVHKTALDKEFEVNKQMDRLDRINRENHFSEGLTKAFHGRTA